MADHYNHYPLKQFAATVARCMDLSLPKSFAPAIGWAADLLKENLGDPADRIVLFHADAVGMYMWQKYPHLFAPVYKHISLPLPFVSTVESVTPVAHASMYTGLDPEEHGIQTYVRPRLTCATLYDVLLMAGLRPAIVCDRDSTFVHIFKGRDMDCFECANGVEVQEKALELIRSDKYDVISIHTCDYDNAAHAFGPESKQGLNALSLVNEIFDSLATELENFRGQHRILLAYAPDHGQHPVPGGTGQHGSKMIEDMNIMHFFGTIGEE